MHRSTLASSDARSGEIEPETLTGADVSTQSPPGTVLGRRPLHFIWMIDCSGSMTGAKIYALNQAMREMLPFLRVAAKDNPNAELLMRVVAFSDGARWHIADPTPIEEFKWQDLVAGNTTDAGTALRMVANALTTSQMPKRALPPVLVLVLDGSPTDDFEAGLRSLNEQPWGRKAVRLGIAVGQYADRNALRSFMGTDREPLEMHNSEQLLNYIRWVSTSFVGSSQKLPDDMISVPPQDTPEIW